MKNNTVKMIPKVSGQEYWTKIIRESQVSNLSNKEFCKQQGIAISAFYYWKKRITNVPVSNNNMSLIEIPDLIKDSNCPGNNNDIISLSVNQEFCFHISFDLKTVLPIIQEILGKRK